jgi:cytochrome c
MNAARQRENRAIQGESGMNGERSLLTMALLLTIPARRWWLGTATAAVLAAGPGSAAGAGDPVQGAQAFRNCIACHSIETGQNMTGPTLAGVLGRKAGSLTSFHRYSDALKRSGVVWDEQSLDAWIGNPAAFIPGNDMAFPGLPDARARSNLVAFLKAASEGNGKALAFQAGMNMGGLPDLKEANADVRVKAIRYCDDTYTVTTGAGKKRKFWEFNLRFKTDSSAHGPRKNEPILVGQGMQGDRAQIVFASPSEMGAFIKSGCP